MSTDDRNQEMPDHEVAAFLDRFHGADYKTTTYRGEPEGDRIGLADNDKIRRFHPNRSDEPGGIAPYDTDNFSYPNLMPNVLEKTHDPEPPMIAGGTDLLAIGKPGTGKSTLANHLALREIEVNDSKVVWRASNSRSEWLPLAPWVKLCLPEGVIYDAVFEPVNPEANGVTCSLSELEGNVVREVERYSDPLDLNKNVLEAGKIHVVYPDPKMRGLQDLYEGVSTKQYEEPKDRGLFDPEDPAPHWWFGWVLARIEYGPHGWTSLILDEIGDIAPQGARKDQFGTYQKVQLLKDLWVDARKKGLSIYAFGHSGRDIAAEVRRKLRWRITMNGKANPTSAGSVVGFDSVPMRTDMASRLDVGQGLIWNETNFEKIAWSNFEPAVKHKLRLEAVQ